MSNIAKMQEEFFELTDLEKEIEEKLSKETNPIEIKKLNRMLSAIANTIEVTDLEIKHACVNQELEGFYQQKIDDLAVAIKEDPLFEGDPIDIARNYIDAKDVWYEFWDIKAAEAADDAFEEVVKLPEEPINSWES